MSEQPESVTLVEKLRSIPENLSFECPSHWSIGATCHEAAARITEPEAQLAEARELLIVADYGYPAAEPDTVHAVEKWRVLRETWMEALEGQEGKW